MIPVGYGWWVAAGGVLVLAWGVAAAAVNELRRRAKRWRRRHRHQLDVLPWATVGLAMIVAGSWQGMVDTRDRAQWHPGFGSGVVWVLVAAALVIVWRIIAASVRDHPDLEYRLKRRGRRPKVTVVHHHHDDGGDGDDE